MVKHVAVSVTPAGRDALRTLAVLGTTAAGRKLSMSEAAIAALAVVRDHLGEFRAALASPEGKDS